MMKEEVRVIFPGQSNHLFGDVDPFRLEAMLDQLVNETAAAPATNVQGESVILCELDRALELKDAIGLETRLAETISDGVVTSANCFWIHDVLRYPWR